MNKKNKKRVFEEICTVLKNAQVIEMSQKDVVIKNVLTANNSIKRSCFKTLIFLFELEICRDEHGVMLKNESIKISVDEFTKLIFALPDNQELQKTFWKVFGTGKSKLLEKLRQAL